MYSVTVEGRQFNIRALTATQLDRAQLMARQAAPNLTDEQFAALPVEQRYYQPFVLEEGIVSGIRITSGALGLAAAPLHRAIVHISTTGGAPAEVL